MCSSSWTFPNQYHRYFYMTSQTHIMHWLQQLTVLGWDTADYHFMKSSCHKTEFKVQHKKKKPKQPNLSAPQLHSVISVQLNNLSVGWISPTSINNMFTLWNLIWCFSIPSVQFSMQSQSGLYTSISKITFTGILCNDLRQPKYLRPFSKISLDRLKDALVTQLTKSGNRL